MVKSIFKKVIIIGLLVFLFVYLVFLLTQSISSDDDFLLINKSIVEDNDNYIDITDPSIERDYTPRNVEQYSKSLEFKINIYDIFTKSLDNNILQENEKQKITYINLLNNNFEMDDDQDQTPDNWYYYGMLEYTSRGCLSGRCMHLKADDTGYGVIIINSESMIVEPGKIYETSLKINCITCENDAAYIGVFWMDEGDREIDRNIQILENTDKYEDVTITAKASVGAVKAIFGIRVHEEGARINPITELYIDN